MPHVSIAATPEHRMENRAHNQTGLGHSQDDGLVRKKNPFLISFEDWRGSFSYQAEKPWARAFIADPVPALHRKIRERIRRASGWTGQVYFFGHAQNASRVAVGGFASTKTVPAYNHGIVDGGAFGTFLANALPLDSVPVVDVVLLAGWLGNFREKATSGFLRDLLTALGGTRRPVLVHSTRYETWPGTFDDICVNGARIDRPASGPPTPDHYATLRAKVYAHTADGSGASREATWAIDRDHLRLVEKHFLHNVGASVKTLEDVRFLNHRGLRNGDDLAVFNSFYLDGSGALAVDTTRTRFDELRKPRIGRTPPQPVLPTPTALPGGDHPPKDVPEPTESPKTHFEERDEILGPGGPGDPKPQPLTPEEVKVLAPDPTRGPGPTPEPLPTHVRVGEGDRGDAKGPTFDASGIRRRPFPEPMGRARVVTVEGFDLTPERPRYGDLQEAREIALEGPLALAHAWQRTTFYASRLVNIDGPHAPPSPRRFEQFLEARSQTVEGHPTLPIRAWLLEPPPAPKKPEVKQSEVKQPEPDKPMPKDPVPEMPVPEKPVPTKPEPEKPVPDKPVPGTLPIVCPPGGTVLDIETVSQGFSGGVHEHNCFLAACLTVQNFLTGQHLTMDEGWRMLGRVAPPRDRIRATFLALKLPSRFTYMAAVAYTGSDKQLILVAETIARGWPVMIGVGPKALSTAKIGHYIVLGGVDGSRPPKQILLLDPWAALQGDRGSFVRPPAEGAPAPGLRASKGWSFLEVYFPKNYKQSAK